MEQRACPSDSLVGLKDAPNETERRVSHRDRQPGLGAPSTVVVYWIGGGPRVGAFDSFEDACAVAGGDAVGWSEVSAARAIQLLALGTEVEW